MIYIYIYLSSVFFSSCHQSLGGFWRIPEINMLEPGVREASLIQESAFSELGQHMTVYQ